MTYVGNATRKWKNVSNITIEFDDKKENELLENDWIYGYIGITIKDGVGYITKKDGTKTLIELEDNMPIKARLAKVSELASMDVGCLKTQKSCPTWIVENLRFEGIDKYSINSEHVSGTPIYNIKGYWIISSYSDNTFTAGLIHRMGYISGNNTYLTNDYGVRPVITVSRLDFLQN